MGSKRLDFYSEAVAEFDGGKGATQWKIRDWKPVYTKILVLVGKGMGPHQIAQEAEIGYTKRQLVRVIQDPLFRLKLMQYTKKMDTAIVERATEELTKVPEIEIAKIKLAEATEKAADTVIALLDPSSTLYQTVSLNERRLMLTVAQDIINRAGLKTVVSEESNKQGREYSPDEIRSALDNAKELEAIATRLDGRNSSYVLSKEERRDVSAAELAPEPPDFNRDSFLEQEGNHSDASETTPLENKENTSVDDSPN